ncbi:MAG: hypothetical protein ACRD0L_08180, partial [Acidimicrobiales bacterium]
ETVRANSLQIAELAETVRANSLQIAELAETVRANSRQIAELRESVTELRESVTGLRASVTELRDIAVEHTRQILGLADRVGTLGGDLAGMRLEARYRHHPYGYFGALVRRARTVYTGELADMLEEAVAGGRLTPEEAADVALADVVVAGTDGGEPAYLVVEVSRTVGPSDVERAGRRAGLLVRAGHRARGVVAGAEISGPATTEADEAGVAVVLDGRRVA